MELTKDIATEWWMEALNDELDPVRKDALMVFLKKHPDFHQELLESAELWHRMADLEALAPSTEMDLRFENMLRSHTTHSQQRLGFSDRLIQWVHQHWAPGLAFLVIGLAIGIFLIPDGQSPDREELAHLSSEVGQMKKMLMLSLIEKPQAQDRIKAVNMVSELGKNDEKITEALISTLNKDPSVNVRLAALEALMSYGTRSSVREALIRSIALQNSPLMQVALADAMVVLQEKSSIDAFNQILRSSGVDENVKSKLEFTIETLKEI